MRSLFFRILLFFGLAMIGAAVASFVVGHDGPVEVFALQHHRWATVSFSNPKQDHAIRSGSGGRGQAEPD